MINDSRGKEWEVVSLSDPDVVKGLLRNRREYDLTFRGLPYSASSESVDLSSGVYMAKQLEEISCAYIDLDRVMKNVRLSRQQTEVLNDFINGESYSEIAERLKITERTVERIIDTACGCISEESKRQWWKWFFNHKLGLKNKKCSMCKEDLPATEEFFGNDDNRKDGFFPYCKKCDSLRRRK